MDIALARTFLQIVEAGSFATAAEQLYVTQSTVSARIKSLEEQLGQTLFQRSKAGASMTLAGEQFFPHAVALVRIWEQARHEVSLPEGYSLGLTVGAQFSLWDGFLLHWLGRIREDQPEIAWRTEVGTSAVLMRRLGEGTLDLAVMYRPQARPGFDIELLLEEELVLVTRDAKPLRALDGRYVFVDWGPEFREDHGLNFPEATPSGLFLELGSLSLSYILEFGGHAYFPRRLVAEHLASGELRIPSWAPVFSYPAYAVYPQEADAGVLQPALGVLREIAAAVTET